MNVNNEGRSLWNKFDQAVGKLDKKLEKALGVGGSKKSDAVNDVAQKALEAKAKKAEKAEAKREIKL